MNIFTSNSVNEEFITLHLDIINNSKLLQGSLPYFTGGVNMVK